MLNANGTCDKCPNFCLKCSSNAGQCEICESGFYLDSRDGKCYIDIYTPTNQTEVTQIYRLANAEPLNFTISEDGISSIWTNAKGRIELKAGDTWGTICSHNVNAETCRVICKSVGLPTENAEVVANYPIGADYVNNIWFDDVACDATKTELKYCSMKTYIEQKGDLCDHTMDLGAICK